MLVKVRDGLVRYHTPSTRAGRDYDIRTAFRGMTLDVTEDEAKRLLALGSVVHQDTELPKGGRMRELPSTASNEEMKAWVSVATQADIDDVIANHPNLADRLLDARDQYEKDLAAQNLLQGGADPNAVPQGGDLANGESGVSVDGTVLTEPVGEEQAVIEADAEDAEEEAEWDYEDVVRGNVGDVSAFLSDHPETSAEVLAAENARAAAADEEPRKGVLHAVEVAASHTA